MRFTVDTTILVYAYAEDDPVKREVARHILLAGVDADLVLTVQAIAEFLNVMRRKVPELFPEAIAQAERWLALYPVIPTYSGVAVQAARLATRYKLQLWDCMIAEAAMQAGARFLLTEDLQDGMLIGEIRIVDPFRTANTRLVAELLQPLPDSGS